jgi:hypothetical protein
MQEKWGVGAPRGEAEGSAGSPQTALASGESLKGFWPGRSVSVGAASGQDSCHDDHAGVVVEAYPGAPVADA